MFPKLQEYIDNRIIPNLDNGVVDDERREILMKIANYITSKVKAKEDCFLNFICTHNSRRSHMGQLWSITAAHYYLPQDQNTVKTFSGGTEATAMNPRAVAAFERAGFQITITEETKDTENPHYMIRFDSNGPVQECFSKVYNDADTNPQEKWAAIMTCDHADQNCPLIPGAELRIGTTFVDPKVSDGTPQEAETYDERCLQIGTQMFYLFRLVQQQL